jgi:hypothetical protein
MPLIMNDTLSNRLKKTLGRLVTLTHKRSINNTQQPLKIGDKAKPLSRKINLATRPIMKKQASAGLKENPQVSISKRMAAPKKPYSQTKAGIGNEDI